MSELEDCLRTAERRLAAAGVDSPRSDAEQLIAHVLGIPRGELRTWPGPLTAALRDRIDEIVAVRSSRVPLQHLTGVAGFRYLDLEVGPGVFVPRPETEAVAGAAVDELVRLTADGIVGPLAIDLCTGSGAIAASLAHEVPGARVVAVEVSEEAFGYAQRNAGGYGVEVRLGDMRDAVEDLVGKAHVVTANPPYIPLQAYESVPPEVRDHDPAVALWSGEDGLDAIAEVAEVAARLLVGGGLAVCEHADVQGESAPAVFAAEGHWTKVRDNLDLAGRSRFVTARRARRDDARLAR